MSAETMYGVHPGLFKSEPPNGREVVRSLFCGREYELQYCTSTLRDSMVRDGEQSRDFDKQPWIIHGESRAGKSHLARRILTDLDNGEDILSFIIPARERLQAVKVMETLFNKIANEFTSRHSSRSLWEKAKDVVAESPETEVVLDIIDKVQALSHSVEGIDLTISATTKDAFEVGGSTSILPGILKILAKSGRQNTDGRTTVFKLRPPNADDYVNYCSLIIGVLRREYGVKSVLVLVDDVDLIEGYKDPEQNGRVQRLILAASLIALHQIPCVEVVVTSRSWYAYANKEFQELVNLYDFDMSENEIVEIYRRRWKAYAPRVPGGFLNEDALLTAAQDVQGIPGVFLQHMDTAFKSFLYEKDWGPRDYDWYLKVFVRRFTRCRDKHPDATNAIQRHVEAGRKQIDVRENNIFQSTMLENDFAFQSYHNEHTYFIDGLAEKVVRAVATMDDTQQGKN
ncbi:MAG: ATP-binding protein [Alphaproteobacteria bacterium]